MEYVLLNGVINFFGKRILVRVSGAGCIRTVEGDCPPVVFFFREPTARVISLLLSKMKNWRRHQPHHSQFEPVSSIWGSGTSVHAVMPLGSHIATDSNSKWPYQSKRRRSSRPISLHGSERNPGAWGFT